MKREELKINDRVEIQCFSILGAGTVVSLQDGIYVKLDQFKNTTRFTENEVIRIIK